MYRQKRRIAVLLTVTAMLLLVGLHAAGAALAQPSIVNLTSPTHPTPGTWYTTKDASFAWDLSAPGDALGGYQYTMSTDSAVSPDPSPQTISLPGIALSAAVPYSTSSESGPNSRAMAIGDFNGDEILDLVVGNYIANTVSILMGDGDGTFAAPQEYPVNRPEAVAVGDFDNDSYDDLGVVSWDTQLTVLLNDKTGAFSTSTVIDTAIGCLSVRVGFVNADGDADIVVAGHGYPAAVKIYSGDGTGGFSAPIDLNVGHQAEDALVADIDGDSTADLLVAHSNDYDYSLLSEVSVWHGLGNGLFTPLGTHQTAATSGTVSSSPNSLTVADFDGDGMNDFATANVGLASAASTTVFLNIGLGVFDAGTSYPTDGESRSIAAGDFDGDSCPDLAVANNIPNSISVLHGKGDGTFAPATDYSTGIQPAEVTVGDFDGNGRPDVVTANLHVGGTGTVSVFLNKSRTLALDDLPDGLWFFRLRASDPDGNWGTVVSRQISIDSVPPTVTPTVTPVWYDETWCKGAVTYVSLDATDDGSGLAQLDYRVLDEGAPAPGESDWWTYTSSIWVPNPGQYRVWYRAADALGNSTGAQSIKVWVDGQPPVITVTEPRLGPEPYPHYEQDSSVSSSFSATDDYFLRGLWAEVQPPTGGPRTIHNGDPLPTDLVGGYTITVHANDGAYNEWTQTGHYWVYPAGDVTPPVTTIHNLPGSWTDEPWFTLIATDAPGGSLVQLTEYAIEAGEHLATPAPTTGWQTYTGDPVSFGAGYADGEYTIWYRSIDWAGNMEAAPVAYAFKDSEPPSVNVTVPAQDGEYVQGSVVPIEFTVDLGNGAGLYRADFLDSYGIVIDILNVPTGELGPQTMTYSVTDLAWHEATGSISYTVIPADTTPPTTGYSLSGTMGLNGWFKSGVAVTLTPTDNPGGSGISGGEAGTWYRVNGGDWTAGTSLTIAGDGTYVVDYYSKDAVGNQEADKQLSFKIDKTAPKITVTKPLDATPGDLYTVRQKVYAAGSVTDGIDPLACSGVATQVITNDGVTKTWGAALNTATAGTHEFKVVATDVAGNTVTKIVTYRVSSTADTTPPTVMLTNPEFYDGQSYPLHEELSISFTATDGGGGTSIERWSVSVRLPDGTTINPPLVAAGTHGATTGVVPLFTSTAGAYQATIRAADASGRTTTVVVNYGVAGDWGAGLLADDGTTWQDTPSSDPPTINVTEHRYVPLKFTMSGSLKATEAGSAVMSGLKPRLYVVRIADNKLVFKASTYFTLDPSDGFYKYTFDTNNIFNYIPAGSEGGLFRHIVVFCDPAGAPKFTGGCGCGCGCGCGDQTAATTTDLSLTGTTTVTQLTPTTSDAAVLKLASSSPSGAAAAAAPAAAPVATPSITTLTPNPAALTTNNIASVTGTGLNFGKTSTSNYVWLTGFDVATSGTWSQKATSTYWSSSKVIFNTPTSIAGDVNVQVNVGTAKSAVKLLTISPGSATGTIRYIRGR